MKGRGGWCAWAGGTVRRTSGVELILGVSSFGGGVGGGIESVLARGESERVMLNGLTGGGRSSAIRITALLGSTVGGGGAWAEFIAIRVMGNGTSTSLLMLIPLILLFLSRLSHSARNPDLSRRILRVLVGSSRNSQSPLSHGSPYVLVW